jgi:hypothetical protein
LGIVGKLLLAEQHHGGAQQLPLVSEAEPIQGVNDRHKGRVEPFHSDGGAVRPFDLRRIQIVQWIPRRQFVFPPIQFVRADQQPGMILVLRHPRGCRADPFVRPAVERIRCPGQLGRLEDQDFPVVGDRNPDLFDPGGRFDFADCVRHILQRLIRNLLANDPSRVGHTEYDPAARSIQQRTQRLDPRLQFAGAFLEFQAIRFALGHKLFELFQIHGDLFTT